jgi:4-hydroxy-tetrahydrodipicolinate reductase
VIRVCVAGITGWTGRPVADAVEAAPDLELVAGVSRLDPASFSSVAEALDAVSADVLVDYTHAAVVKQNVLAAVERGVNVVIGSSGLSADDYAEIDALAQEKEVGVIAAGNFSVTAALVLRFATEAARHLDAWEVIDYSSETKQDAPSGTARELAERLEGVRRPTLRVPLDEVHGAREARGAMVAGTQGALGSPAWLRRFDRDRLRDRGRAAHAPPRRRRRPGAVHRWDADRHSGDPRSSRLDARARSAPGLGRSAPTGRRRCQARVVGARHVPHRCQSSATQVPVECHTGASQVPHGCQARALAIQASPPSFRSSVSPVIG